MKTHADAAEAIAREEKRLFEVIENSADYDATAAKTRIKELEALKEALKQDQREVRENKLKQRIKDVHEGKNDSPEEVHELAKDFNVNPSQINGALSHMAQGGDLEKYEWGDGFKKFMNNVGEGIGNFVAGTPGGQAMQHTGALDGLQNSNMASNIFGNVPGASGLYSGLTGGSLGGGNAQGPGGTYSNMYATAAAPGGGMQGPGEYQPPPGYKLVHDAYYEAGGDIPRYEQGTQEEGEDISLANNPNFQQVSKDLPEGISMYDWMNIQKIQEQAGYSALWGPRNPIKNKMFKGAWQSLEGDNTIYKNWKPEWKNETKFYENPETGEKLYETTKYDKHGNPKRIKQSEWKMHDHTYGDGADDGYTETHRVLNPELQRKWKKNIFGKEKVREYEEGGDIPEYGFGNFLGNMFDPLGFIRKGGIIDPGDKYNFWGKPKGSNPFRRPTPPPNWGQNYGGDPYGIGANFGQITPPAPPGYNTFEQGGDLPQYVDWGNVLEGIKGFGNKAGDWIEDNPEIIEGALEAASAMPILNAGNQLTNTPRTDYNARHNPLINNMMGDLSAVPTIIGEQDTEVPTGYMQKLIDEGIDDAIKGTRGIKGPELATRLRGIDAKTGVEEKATEMEKKLENAKLQNLVNSITGGVATKKGIGDSIAAQEQAADMINFQTDAAWQDAYNTNQTNTSEYLRDVLDSMRGKRTLKDLFGTTGGEAGADVEADSGINAGAKAGANLRTDGTGVTPGIGDRFNPPDPYDMGPWGSKERRIKKRGRYFRKWIQEIGLFDKFIEEEDWNNLSPDKQDGLIESILRGSATSL